MANLDPVAFVRSTPPFDALPQELFDGVARSLEVIYYPAGTKLVTVGEQPLQHLYVIRKGAVRLERAGQTLSVLEEGEIFGYTSLLTGKATLDVAVEEDLLAYRIPEAEFRRLLSDASFAGHFAVGMAARLESSLAHSPVATFRVDLAAPVEGLIRRPAVWVDADATVREAARAMTEARVSSVLVRGDPAGIVTDRDFRTQVLARGRGPDTPVAAIVSRSLRTVDAGTPVAEVKACLLATAERHPRIVASPAPFVLFTDFGDKSLTFELHFSIAIQSMTDCRLIESELREAVDAAFRAAGFIQQPSRAARPLLAPTADAASALRRAA